MTGEHIKMRKETRFRSQVYELDPGVLGLRILPVFF
jgi:hypothetical protein